MQKRNPGSGNLGVSAIGLGVSFFDAAEALAQFRNQSVSLRYLAAVAEFDRLWEIGAGAAFRARMDELIVVIENYEATHG